MANAISLLPANPGEEWRLIPGYERTYAISSHGRVWSFPRYKCRGGMRKIKMGKRGYPALILTQNSVGKTFEVHWLVALAFLGARPPEYEIRHLDGDPLNSHLSNLAYGTRSENAQDTLAHGRNWNANKTHCPQGHPYDQANTIRISSRPTARYCRACITARTLARYHARRAVLDAARK